MDVFVNMPAFGVGQASGILAGQNIGANLPDRAEKTGWIAAGLGLDPDELEQEMNSKETRSRIKKDIRETKEAGATGTPAVFVNGRKLRSRSLDGFQNIIDTLLNKK